MYCDKVYVVKKVGAEYKFALVLGVVCLIFDTITLFIVIRGIIYDETSKTTCVEAIIVLFIINSIFIFIFRLYFYRTIIDVEVNHENIAFKCYKAIYFMNRYNNIKIKYGFAGKEIKINLKLINGRLINLYLMPYKRVMFDKLENINYTLLNMLERGNFPL
jgi:hypothetical protein